MRVLVVEDDEMIAEGLRFSLMSEGHEVLSAGTVLEAEKIWRSGIRPDFCLLDVLLPDGDGFSLCREIRKSSKVPVLFLTACDDEVSTVRALELGADDYIAKPFGVMELVARVHAALRRQAGSNVIKIGDLELNSDTMSVTLQGRPLELNKKEFELLKYCMRNADIVLSRDALLTEIWGYVDTETRTLDNHIARLRKMGIDNFETVFGVGYRFKKR